MGKLVPQDPKEESAEELINRINNSRTILLKQGYPNRDESINQLKKQSRQMLPSGLVSLPRGWTWSTLIQLSLLVVDCHNKTAPYTSDGIRLLRTTNIRNGQLNLSEPKFVSDSTYERWSARCKPEAGDILITREAPMGEVCIIPKRMTVCLGQRMMLIRLIPGMFNPQFLLYSFMDPNLMDRVQDKPVGATVQHLRVGGVETLLVPVPPLTEQKRIVAKVDQLMQLCDSLGQHIKDSTEKKSAILNSVLAGV
jgi:type I restriction enzyme S subunit